MQAVEADSLRGALLAALGRIRLQDRVARAMPPLPPTSARVTVIAIGKAAPSMMQGALSRWPSRIERALVVTSDETPCAVSDPRVEIMRAGHPLPDTRNVDAGLRAMMLAGQGRRDLLLVLLSGGTSALVAAPIPGLTLEEKRACTATLLLSGASIAELNTVRRHLSRIKGGGLTRAACPGRVLALIASDVLTGGLEDVGSGPTLPDPSTIADARAVLRARAPAYAGLPLIETLKTGEPEARRQRARLIASPADLSDVVAGELRVMGHAVRVLPPSMASVTALASEYAEVAAELGRGESLVRSAEPSLRVVPSPGARGGRSGHLAALVGPRLPAGVTFLAAGSDGVDGSSGAAGAIVDHRSFDGLASRRYEDAVAFFDTATLHEEAGSALLLEPTGLNFADVHVLARTR